MIMGNDVNFSMVITVSARMALNEVRFSRHRVYLLSLWMGVPLFKNYTTNLEVFHNFVEQSKETSGRNYCGCIRNIKLE